jgi:nicotinate-nucleotide pyrophosphorylase (carboxylating)
MVLNIKSFLKEDISKKDITTDSIVNKSHTSKAIILAKANGVIAGHIFVREVFNVLSKEILYEEKKKDGEYVSEGDILAVLQRLSGIATLTRNFVEAVKGTGVKILDTRKTSPGIRMMEKYAVRMGGGYNHRANLTEMALIKENHLAVAHSIKEAVKRIREKTNVPIEVEVKNKEELKEAIDANVDRIMLDNWDLTSIKYAVSFVKKRVPLEVSGNMDIEKAKRVAKTGVDFISVGALTHSFKSLDISLLLEGIK